MAGEFTFQDFCNIDVKVQSPGVIDPIEEITNLFPKIGGTFGCPQCTSGKSPWFNLKSQEATTPIFSGFTPDTPLTRVTADLWMAEGINGSGINIGSVASGEPVEFVKQRGVLFMASKETMNDVGKLQGAFQELGASSEWAERLKSYDVIGFGELRTNDPLIS